MPVFLIGATALIAGLVRVPPWIPAVAVLLVTAVGVIQTNRKLRAPQHDPDIVAARTPGAILFGLLVYSLVMGLQRHGWQQRRRPRANHQCVLIRHAVGNRRRITEIHRQRQASPWS
jgi:hypothetical protein